MSLTLYSSLTFLRLLIETAHIIKTPIKHPTNNPKIKVKTLLNKITSN